jgi:predicted esterase
MRIGVKIAIGFSEGAVMIAALGVIGRLSCHREEPGSVSG